MTNKVSERVVIQKGAIVTCLDSGKCFVSEREFTAELHQFKIGRCYYRHHNRIFRVNQQEVKDAETATV
jgi:hypothetical protein